MARFQISRILDFGPIRLGLRLKFKIVSPVSSGIELLVYIYVSKCSTAGSGHDALLFLLMDTLYVPQRTFTQLEDWRAAGWRRIPAEGSGAFVNSRPNSKTCFFFNESINY